MATFLLVAGAWHASWCWERIVPTLEAAGHRVIAPDLRGMGEDRTPLSQVTLATWADQIADIIRAEAEPVILVGHSRGGIVISETAERVPEGIRTLVYLTAFLLPAGGTLAEAAASIAVEGEPPFMEEGPEPGTVTVVPSAVVRTFYNTTPDEWVMRAAAKLTPEPVAGLGTPLAVTDERFGRVPRAYIECTLDQAITLPLQREMQRMLPCDPVFTLETDHSPFYSAPDKLAETLLAIAKI